MTQPTHQPDLSQDGAVPPENANPENAAPENVAPENVTEGTSGGNSPEAVPGAKMADAGAEIADKLRAEIAGLKDQLLRTLAEMDNLRKRTDREKEDTAKYAVTTFARDMLAVADNLRRALEAIPSEEREHLDDTLRSLVAGVEMTEKDLGTILGRHGVKAIAPFDETFDPHLHQAMFEVPGSGKPAGTVVQVLQAGYTLHGRLLRPALVGVAKNGTPDAAPIAEKSA